MSHCSVTLCYARPRKRIYLYQHILCLKKKKSLQVFLEICSLNEFEMHLFPSRSSNEGETNLLESFWRAGDGGRTKGMCMVCKVKYGSWFSELPHCSDLQQPVVHYIRMITLAKFSDPTSVIGSALAMKIDRCQYPESLNTSCTHSSQGDFLHSVYFYSNHQACTLHMSTGLLCIHYREEEELSHVVHNHNSKEIELDIS